MTAFANKTVTCLARYVFGGALVDADFMTQ